MSDDLPSAAPPVPPRGKRPLKAKPDVPRHFYKVSRQPNYVPGQPPPPPPGAPVRPELPRPTLPPPRTAAPLASGAAAPPARLSWRETMTPEAKEALLAWLSNGQTLSDFCRTPNAPTVKHVASALKNDEAFAADYAEARSRGFDAIADEVIAIADTEPPIAPDGRIDPGFVAWAKHRTWARLKLLEKWDPKRYGERQMHQHEGGIQLTVETGVPASPAATASAYVEGLPSPRRRLTAAVVAALEPSTRADAVTLDATDATDAEYEAL